MGCSGVEVPWGGWDLPVWRFTGLGNVPQDGDSLDWGTSSRMDIPWVGNILQDGDSLDWMDIPVWRFTGLGNVSQDKDSLDWGTSPRMGNPWVGSPSLEIPWGGWISPNPPVWRFSGFGNIPQDGDSQEWVNIHLHGRHLRGDIVHS